MKSALAIVAVTLTVMLPALLRAPITHDSLWIDWVWADQFTAALREGTLYPRWTPLSHGGLGSPTFYFYPPLAFYVAGLFGLAGLSTYGSLLAAFAFSFAASGFAMLLLLRDSRYPLVGAVAFMITPYHVLDFYSRGALGEHLAFAFIPLVVLGLRRGKLWLLAIAYAGLILTHLPLALLTSIFVVAPMLVLGRAWPAVFALATGIALASIYLAPALLLEPYRSASALWSAADLRAENWSVLKWSLPGPPAGMRLIVVLIVISLVPATFVLRRRVLLAGFALFCCVLALGLIPGLWSLPLLRSVQFPFRILPLAEFAICFAAAYARWDKLKPLVALPPLLASGLFSLMPLGGPSIADLARDYPDVSENLPPGERAVTWPSQWALEQARKGPGTFVFPSVSVTCEGKPVQPDDAGVMRHPAGCQRRVVTTDAERTGAALSLLGILMFALLALLGRRRRINARSRLKAAPAP
jgi:hypothetical protein